MFVKSQVATGGDFSQAVYTIEKSVLIIMGQVYLINTSLPCLYLDVPPQVLDMGNGHIHPSTNLPTLPT